MNRSKALILLSVTCTVVFLVISCTKKEADVPDPVEGMCDTITYEKHIKPIVDANCISCHGDVSPSGGFPLTSYDQLKAKAEAGRIKARVIDLQPSPMPPSPAGPLPQAEQDLINCWLNNGYK